MSRVLYPGSFDPLHLGHLDVIVQAAELFGDVVVAVIQNLDKPTGLFTAAERVALIEESAAADPSLAGKVSVRTFSGLAIDAAADAGVDFIVKGLRTYGDFELEQQMAQTNYSVSGIRTAYVPCDPALVYVSSRFVREIARYGRDVGHMVPAPVAAALQRINTSGTDSR